MERLPGNTKNGLFTRSWTARVRLILRYGTWIFHMWDMTHLLLWQYVRRCSVAFSFYHILEVCDMTHWYVWHDSFTCGTWLFRMWDIHDSSICGTWLIYLGNMFDFVPLPFLFYQIWEVRDMTHWYVWNDLFTCGTWLMYTWDMSLSYVGHDSFITLAICSTSFCCLFFFTRFWRCVIWLTDVFEMTYSHVGHGSFIRRTWLINTWNMSHSFVEHDSSIRGTQLIHI